jgi:hypothetical protein
VLVTKPHLTFFCELETPVLKALFAVPDIAYLGDLDASLSLGILDFSPERAEVVQRLNQAGVPVIAWLLMPRAQGYWLTLEYARAVVERYNQFLQWTADYSLQWDGIGLDIEPDISLVDEFNRLTVSRFRLVRRLLLQTLNRRRLVDARRIYRDLVQRIQRDGYRVDSYQFPFIVDERRSGSTVLQRATGILDLPVDREVLMLYSSFFRPYGAGMIWSYGDEAESIGIGSTGGGVDLGLLETKPLSWDEFARDLRLAWVFTDDIHIFSLEGCIRQGFLARLKDFSFDMPLFDPVELSSRVDAWRAALNSALWILSHPLLIMTAGLAAAVLISRLRRQK